MRMIGTTHLRLPLAAGDLIRGSDVTLFGHGPGVPDLTPTIIRFW